MLLNTVFCYNLLVLVLRSLAFEYSFFLYTPQLNDNVSLEVNLLLLWTYRNGIVLILSIILFDIRARPQMWAQKAQNSSTAEQFEVFIFHTGFLHNAQVGEHSTPFTDYTQREGAFKSNY